MSFRLPRNFSSGLLSEQGVSAFDNEVLAEKAATLGRTGRALADRLAALRDNQDPASRDGLIAAAAEAAYVYLVQRDVCGLTDHRAVVEDYQIPHEVMVRVGARRRARD